MISQIKMALLENETQLKYLSNIENIVHSGWWLKYALIVSLVFPCSEIENFKIIGLPESSFRSGYNQVEDHEQDRFLATSVIAERLDSAKKKHFRPYLETRVVWKYMWCHEEFKWSNQQNRNLLGPDLDMVGHYRTNTFWAVEAKFGEVLSVIG